jgi:hypothetical protein
MDALGLRGAGQGRRGVPVVGARARRVSRVGGVRLPRSVSDVFVHLECPAEGLGAAGLWDQLLPSHLIRRTLPVQGEPHGRTSSVASGGRRLGAKARLPQRVRRLGWTHRYDQADPHAALLVPNLREDFQTRAAATLTTHMTKGERMTRL